MSETAMEKRRRTTGPTKGHASKIFSPFRALGLVSNEVPFAVGMLGTSFYIVTSVGRAFQVYDAATIHLLFVSNIQTPAKISTLTAYFQYVYAGYGNTVGIFRRGKLEAEISVDGPTGTTITKIICFGDYLVAATSVGDLFVFRKPSGLKLHTELHTVIRSIAPETDGDIVGMCHPPTYLNKIVVATASHVVILNVRTGKTIFKSDAFDEKLTCVEHAPALDVVGLGTATGGVFLYNIRTGQLLGDRIIASPADVQARVVSVSFRSDGTDHLLAALNNGDLFFYDLNNRARVLVQRNVHLATDGGISNAVYLNGQPIVVTNGADNKLQEWVFDPAITASNATVTAPPRLLRSRGGHSASPVSICFPDEEKSHFLYSASRDNTVWRFSLRKDAQAQELSQNPPKARAGTGKAWKPTGEKFSEVTGLAMSVAREGEWDNLLTTHKNETFARTWNTKTARVGHHMLSTVDGGIAKSICVSHCGNFALVGSSNGGIGAFNLQSGILRRKFMLHKKTVTGLAIDGMNRNMVSCGLDGIVGFYNFSESKYLGSVKLDAPITLMIYHKGSDLVACALDDLSIVVLDVVTRRIVRVLYGHTNRITSMEFSPDGRWIVSVALDSTMRTWDLPTGSCVDGVILPSVATTVKFSPIGDFLATTHVSGNGIALWTNRAQFRPVSSRHVEEADFKHVNLPNISGDNKTSMIDGALDDDEDDADALDLDTIYQSVDQIEKNLLTLTVGPRTKYQTVLHIETIKQRNKPKEAPKKPEQAPFFLALKGEAVGDRAIVSENGLKQAAPSSISEEESRLVKLNGDKSFNFESKFTTLLREGAASGDYDALLVFLVNAAPSVIDLEIRSLNTFPPLTELSNFVDALTQGLQSNANFDIYEAIFGLFIKNHGDVVYANHRDLELAAALEKWNTHNQSQGDRLDKLVKHCAGVLDFITSY